MRHFVVAIRDRGADFFHPPFCVAHLGLALRSFGDAINNPETPMHAHSEDFDLYHLGAYDDAHARFDLLADPVQIAVGKDVPRPGTGAPRA